MNKNDDPNRTAPSKGCGFLAAQDISFAGESFDKGEKFPYQELGFSEQNAFNIWKQKLIDVDPAVRGSNEPLVPEQVKAETGSDQAKAETAAKADVDAKLKTPAK